MRLIRLLICSFSLCNSLIESYLVFDVLFNSVMRYRLEIVSLSRESFDHLLQNLYSAKLIEIRQIVI